MKRIDFYEKKKALHNEMLEAIVALFEKTSITEIDFMPDDGGWQRNCFVIISTDGVESTEEVMVKKVRCEDGDVFILPFGRDMWVSCEHAGRVVTATLDDLYDAVYDVVGDLNFVYYVCDLDDNGKPNGITCKRTWRLEYAENFKKERIAKYGKSYVFNNRETALLHARYKS
jgi:hypothetical protein